MNNEMGNKTEKLFRCHISFDPHTYTMYDFKMPKKTLRVADYLSQYADTFFLLLEISPYRLHVELNVQSLCQNFKKCVVKRDKGNK